MTAADVEALAYEYMARKNEVGVDSQHNHQVIPGCTIVESFIAREGDPDFIPGSWVVCCHVDDDATWEKIKAGELNGFSMEALVLKEEVEAEIDIPSTIKGSTSETDGHTHRFAVKFTADGEFEGGATDEVMGHSHKILAGTITQESHGHTHRFSTVDDIKIVEIE